ncbi:uncharacterized protein LOC142348791 [Convolutriloba macropyga]|uniref:uncharacterized protein LOC142348791 n=1 Tax=Convolutriloba macropyga TaxID=536237 RepID=UPI003F51AC78
MSKMDFSGILPIVKVFLLLAGIVLAETSRHETQMFTIASLRTDLIAQQCASWSHYFCLAGYAIVREREAGHQLSPEIELAYFEESIRLNFQRYRWFSYNEPYGCCSYQTYYYKSYGMTHGLTAAEYMSKAINFESRKNKRLNFVKAIFIRELCLNVISQVGFGIGEFYRQDGVRNIDYILPLDARAAVQRFSYDEIEKELTYNWMKENVICMEAPWICEEYPIKNNSYNCAIC